jgi:hypothetical protein
MIAGRLGEEQLGPCERRTRAAKTYSRSLIEMLRVLSLEMTAPTARRVQPATGMVMVMYDGLWNTVRSRTPVRVSRCLFTVLLSSHV